MSSISESNGLSALLSLGSVFIQLRDNSKTSVKIIWIRQLFCEQFVRPSLIADHSSATVPPLTIWALQLFLFIFYSCWPAPRSTTTFPRHYLSFPSPLPDPATEPLFYTSKQPEEFSEFFCRIFAVHELPTQHCF